MKTGSLFFVLVSVISVLSVESCYYDKADLLYPGSNLPCDTSIVAKYSSDVLPVMNTSCNVGGCHNSNDAASGIILDTYSGIATQANNGKLMGSMNHDAGYAAMPKNSAKLPSCTLIKIQQWISSGTLNN
ncbi:MAG: hypothetical protein IPL84_13630 [Chitinophagaceae bacterium]|nr:hypothetical protein [Chitinophagaceae bacterium]